MIYKSRHAVFKLCNDYSSIVSKAKYKTVHVKGIPSIPTCATQGRLAKVSNQSNRTILSPKKLLQRLPITLVQVKAGNISENLPNEARQIKYSLWRANEITKKI